MEKQWKYFLAFVIILLWNGCGKESVEPKPSLLTPSAIPVTIQPTKEEDKIPTEPVTPTESIEPTGAEEPTAPADSPVPSDVKMTAPADSPVPTLTDAEPSLGVALPDYNPEEILCQKGGVVIPWGDSICVDMDGDGREETVSMRLTIDSEHSGNDWRFALPVLMVDSAVFLEEDFWELFADEDDMYPDFTYPGWVVLDLDVSDSYLEIAVECHHYRDFKTCFLRYGQGQFSYMGSIETNVTGFLDYPMSVLESSEWKESFEPDWEAARTEIYTAEEPLRLDGIRGDGMIHLGAYHDVLEHLELGEMTWRLENPDDLYAKLVLDQPYLDYGEAEIQSLKTLKQDTFFYRNKGGEDGETVMVPAGTQVWFRRYDPEGRWMEMTYDEGGTYEDGKQSVWFQVVEEAGEFYAAARSCRIRLPEGMAMAYCLFGGFIWGD